MKINEKKGNAEFIPPTVDVTLDYSLFFFKEDNRDIKRKFVEDLKKSFTQAPYYKYSPILVLENPDICPENALTPYFILDGQHRFIALKELNLPVYYIELPHDIEYIFLNVFQNKWAGEDFLKFHCAHGNETYNLIAERSIKYKLLTNVVLALTGFEGGKKVQSYKFGNFQFPKMNLSFDEIAEKYIEFRDFCFRKELKPQKCFCQLTSIQAFSTLINYPGFSWTHFMEKFSTNCHTLLPGSCKLDYLKNFLKIYNKGKKMNILTVEDYQKNARINQINSSRILI